MTKAMARERLQELSIELDKKWHASYSEGHDGHYRDLLDSVLVQIDEIEFQLRKSWLQDLVGATKK